MMRDDQIDLLVNGFPDDRWRDGRPGLARWYEAFSQRPSIRATQPPAA